ncbi:phytanoyl-CoA dioxygenase family protein [Streptomyces sp. NBC_01476]|uniref:phytanoyl-CoA dioxygenase family protein n=1 Tax=Streptomyces sp. NBC_01476 TaxID=2903881 RepID=UPI002E356B20|nr:phytanoyl-CoA dioxygenase family protein [Streptomyces sp. NBC_01476]
MAAEITDDMRTTFRREGYLIVPDVLTPSQIDAGRQVVAAMLAKQPPAEGHVGPHFVFRHFGDQGHPLLDFFFRTRIGELAGQLLRDGLGIQRPEGVQLATTIPPWPYPPGGPHVDGLTPTEPDGRPGTFTLLAGTWLTDHTTPGRGNLWLWPGTHLKFGQYLAERGADALTRVADMAPGPYPKIELGDPVQAVGPAGSVLFAHYLLAHNIGDHTGSAGDERRETLYYRLQADGHRARWQEAVTTPLTEFA